MYIVGYFFFKKLMVFGIIFIKHCVKYLIEFDTISSKKNKQIRYIIYQFEKAVTRYNRSLKTERKRCFNNIKWSQPQNQSVWREKILFQT